MPTNRWRASAGISRTLLWLRIIVFITLGALSASIIISTYFIYVYIYQTLDYSNAITVLSAGNAYEVLDVGGYKLVEDRIDMKNMVPIPPKSTRNMFVTISSTAAAPDISSLHATSSAPR